MITFQQISRYVVAEPFRPFRIRMANGRTIEVRYPDMIHVKRTTMTISTFMSDDPEEVKEQKVKVSLLSIESVEPLDVGVQQPGK